MTRTLSVLGSTGSIGVQTLEVAETLGIGVRALAAHSNVALLEEQARRWRPALVAVADRRAAADLRVRLADTPVRVAAGADGVLEAACVEGADTVLAAMVGVAGLKPALAAIDAGKRLALANKETLVCAGDLVMRRAEGAGAEVVPVDSEHSAIFQCLQGCRDRGEVKRLILTASGGPFFGRTRAELTGVTAAQALRHPNWSMGAKVTIDSATLMNKGLELMEAMALYHMPPEKIGVVIHRESIIHSLVEYCDNAMLAQLGVPDMRLPIEYALTWPARGAPCAPPLDLLTCPPLTFAPPDEKSFPCLALAREAARRGGVAPAVLNGANEVAVAHFLKGEIGFYDIADMVERALAALSGPSDPTVEDILAADGAARALFGGTAPTATI